MSDDNENKVYMQGIGLVPGKKVSEIKAGDFLTFKYGSQSKVIEVLGDKSGYRIMKIQDSKSGHYSEVKKKLTTVVALAKPF